MVIDFIPFKRVSDFYFTDEIKKYIFKYDFDINVCSDATNWDEYSLDSHGISIYTDKEKIESISCNKSMLYNGKEIIGISILDFVNMFKLKVSEKPDKIYMNELEIQYTYEFDAIGLQVWCLDNRIVTAIASI